MYVQVTAEGESHTLNSHIKKCEGQLGSLLYVALTAVTYLTP
jgi:hypothetical protein